MRDAQSNKNLVRESRRVVSYHKTKTAAPLKHGLVGFRPQLAWETRRINPNDQQGIPRAVGCHRTANELCGYLANTRSLFAGTSVPLFNKGEGDRTGEVMDRTRTDTVLTKF